MVGTPRLIVILRHGTHGTYELVAIEEGAPGPARPITAEQVVERLRRHEPTSLIDEAHGT